MPIKLIYLFPLAFLFGVTANASSLPGLTIEQAFQAFENGELPRITEPTKWSGVTFGYAQLPPGLEPLPWQEQTREYFALGRAGPNGSGDLKAFHSPGYSPIETISNIRRAWAACPTGLRDFRRACDRVAVEERSLFLTEANDGNTWEIRSFQGDLIAATHPNPQGRCRDGFLTYGGMIAPVRGICLIRYLNQKTRL